MSFKNLIRLLLASLLVGTSVSASINTEVKAEEPSFNYVSFGASQTAGFGLRGFLPDEFYIKQDLIWSSPDGSSGRGGGLAGIGQSADSSWGYYSDGYNFHPNNSYPELIKNALAASMPGTKINLERREMNAMRALDLEYLLHEDRYSTTDWYYNFLIKGWVNSNNAERNNDLTYFDTTTGKNVTVNHKKAKTDMVSQINESIQKADLITYDLGVNDFGGYLMSASFVNYLPYMGGGNDLTKFVDQKYVDYYDEVKGYLLDVISDYAGDKLDSTVLNRVIALADTIAYSFVGYCVAFDGAMEHIYTYGKDDVKVVAVAIQNVYNGIHFDINGTDIAGGKLLGAVIDMANAYMTYLSPYAGRYYVADFGKTERVEYFFDDMMNWDGTLDTLMETTDLLDSFNIYQENLQIQSRVEEEVLAHYKSVYDSETTMSYPELIYTLKHSDATKQSIAASLEKEAEFKEKVSYYTIASLLHESTKHRPTMPFVGGGGLGSSDTAFTRLLLNKTGKKYTYEVTADTTHTGFLYNARNLWSDTFLASDANFNKGLDDALTAVDGYIATITQSDKNEVVSYLIQAGYALSFAIHPNANGHVELANRIMDAYTNKRSPRNEAIKDIVDVVNTTRQDCIDAIVKINDRVVRIALEEQAAIDQTKADLKEAFDTVAEFFNNADEYLDLANDALVAIRDFLEDCALDGIVDDAIASAMSAIEAQIVEVVTDVERLMADLRFYYNMDLAVLRTFTPRIARAVEAMNRTAALVATRIVGVAEGVYDSLVWANNHYSLFRDITIDGIINTIIGTRKTMIAIYKTIQFAKFCNAVSIDVLRHVEAVYERMILEVQRANRFIVRIEEAIIGYFVDRYYDIPEEIRVYLDRAIRNIVNQFEYDINKLNNQVSGLLNHIGLATIDEIVSIFDHYIDMWEEIEHVIIDGINEALEGLLLETARVTVHIALNAEEAAVTIVGTAIYNTVRLGESLEDGVAAIANALIDEITHLPTFDFYQRHDQIVAAEEEMVDTLIENFEEVAEATDDAADHIYDKVIELLRAWKIK